MRFLRKKSLIFQNCPFFSLQLFPPDGLGNAEEGAADTEAAVRVEAAGSVGPDATGRVIDLAAPTPLFGIVFQTFHDYDSVTWDIAEGFVRIPCVETEIAVAVKQGGADPNSNSKLRDAIAKAKANNMPNDNISRSIKKASGELGSINYEEMTYEGYGVGGTAFIVQALTDNKNRTAGDVRHLFDKYGGSLGATGCVSFMFKRKGVIAVAKSDISEDDLMMYALEAGAEDINSDDDEVYEVLTAPADFGAVRDELEKNGVKILSAEIDMIPENEANPDPQQQETLLKMIDKLEELDDVQNVYHNAVITIQDEEED